jgi:hypothetical protein
MMPVEKIREVEPRLFLKKYEKEMNYEKKKLDTKRLVNGELIKVKKKIRTRT